MTTALPASLTYGVLTGGLIAAVDDSADPDLYPDRQAITGTVTLTPSVASVVVVDAKRIMVPKPITSTISTDGTFSVTLLATDNPAMNPSGWTYTVSFRLDGGVSLPSFALAVPTNSVQDLSTVAPVQSSGGVAITQGPAGPTAVFDADAVPYLNATAPAPTGPGVQPANKRLVTEASPLLTNNAGAATFTISGVNPAIIMKASASVAWTVQSMGINNLTFFDKSSRGHITLTYGVTAAAAITHMASTLEIEEQLKVGTYGPVLNNRQISDTVATGVIDFALRNWPTANPGQSATSVSFEASGGVKIGAATIYTGVGVPGFAPNADGDIYLRTDGGAGTTLYQRRTGAWVATAA